MDEQDIRYAQVHLDEAIPHIHMGIIPFTKDKKLNAKKVFSKTIVHNIQANLTQHLHEAGLNVEVIPTMTISTVKNSDSDPDTGPSTPEVQQIVAIPQARTLKPTPKTQTIIREANDQLFTQDEWDDLSEMHQQFNAIKDENKSLKQKIKKLKRANKYLVNEVNLLKMKYGEESLDLEVRETVLDDLDYHI